MSLEQGLHGPMLNFVHVRFLRTEHLLPSACDCLALRSCMLPHLVLLDSPTFGTTKYEQKDHGEGPDQSYIIRKDGSATAAR